MNSMNDRWDQAYEMGRIDALKQAIEVVSSTCSADSCGCTSTAVDAINVLASQSS